MYLLTLIFGIVLLPEAYTLKCYECKLGATGTCTDTTKECPLQGQCGAKRITVYRGRFKVNDIEGKSCVSAEECGENSVNFGFARTVITNKCCTSELCNTQPAPELSGSNPNGKKCFYCDEQTCTNTLNCVGNEDHCSSFLLTVGDTKVDMKGCVSKEICSQKNNSEISQLIGTAHRCCQGDFCNSASSTSAGLLLLVAPLVSLVMFS